MVISSKRSSSSHSVEAVSEELELQGLIMPNGLIQEEDLMEWSGFKRRAPLVTWLRSNRVPYLLGRGGRVCVTLDAIHLPLLRIQQEEKNKVAEIEFV